MYYYEIYVENNQGIYTYKSEEKYEIGQWCIVNFINKDKMGLIVAIVNENQIQFDISKVKKIKDAAPVLSIPSDIMQLIRWIKNYYISDYYSVIKAVYPGALKLNYSKKAIYQKDFWVEECWVERDDSEKNLEEIKKFNEYMKKSKGIAEYYQALLLQQTNGDELQILDLLESSAKQGNVKAYYMIGNIYENKLQFTKAQE